MNINLEKLQNLVLRDPMAVAERLLGKDGLDRVKAILYFLRRCSRNSSVDATTEILVFSLMHTDTKVDGYRPIHATAYQEGVSAIGTLKCLMIEIREDGSAFVWKTIPSDIDPIVQKGITYRLFQAVEKFTIAETVVVLDKVLEATISQIFINKFSHLKDALIAYRDTMARTSKCHLLREAWSDENRVWFSQEPEFRLRRSLCNFLYPSLRVDDIDLRPEQNVDESHPVDIKIVWRMERHTAIIEVKWVGKSIDPKSKTFTAEYADWRARDGAKQLAEYLEKHKQEAAQENTRGYLVVFDCRRHRTQPTDKTVDKTRGMHYANQELVYSPEYHKDRDDFEEPIRIFLEPVCI